MKLNNSSEMWGKTLQFIGIVFFSLPIHQCSPTMTWDLVNALRVVTWSKSMLKMKVMLLLTAGDLFFYGSFFPTVPILDSKSNCIR